MDGYILGAKRPEALPLDERVRCVLTFEPNRYGNVEGFAAFSDLDEYEAGELAIIGAGDLALTAPLPGLPLPFDPSNPDGLKNKVCRAHTVIAEYLGAGLAPKLARYGGVVGMSYTNLGLLLVEFGDGWRWPNVAPGAVREDRVASVRDIRTLVAV